MGEGGGLGVLEVCESRHHALRVSGGKIEQCPPQVGERGEKAQDLLFEPNPYAGGYLVVSRPADVETPADILAHALDEAGLFAGMDVLEPFVERRLRETVIVEIQERCHQRTRRGVLDYPLPPQPEQVRHIHKQVCPCYPAVSVHRCKEALDIVRPFACKTTLSNLIRPHPINSPVCSVWLW